MVKHFNLGLTRILQRIFGFNSVQVSSEVIDAIQPVVDVTTPEMDIIREAGSTTTGTVTVYTTPSNQDFYLKSIYLSYMHDAACNSINIYVQVVKDNITRILVWKRKLTLTADNGQVYVPYDGKGIKLDRNSTIQLVTGFSVGNGTQQCVITGYTQDIQSQ